MPTPFYACVHMHTHTAPAEAKSVLVKFSCNARSRSRARARARAHSYTYLHKIHTAAADVVQNSAGFPAILDCGTGTWYYERYVFEKERLRERHGRDGGGVFCYATGLFCYATGLFCYATGLFCYATGLFCYAIGLFCYAIGTERLTSSHGRMTHMPQ